MLKWLASRQPPRTSRSDLGTIILDNGRSKIVFNRHLINGSRKDLEIRSSAPTSRFLVFISVPPGPSPPTPPNFPNSSLSPPFHIHLKEDETFHVLRGTARFLLLDQRLQKSSSIDRTESNHDSGVTTRLVYPGCTITIPRGQIHTFRNASTTDRLEIEFGFDTPMKSPFSKPPNANSSDAALELNTKMHAFFLHTPLYRSDCVKHNVPKSLSQVLLFNHHADMALVPIWLLSWHARYPFLRVVIERVIAPMIGRSMNVVGGVVLGNWVLGLKERYEEYITEAPLDQVVDKVEREGHGMDGRIAGFEADITSLRKRQHRAG